MNQINSYRDLLVWQRSMELVVALYKFVTTLPKEETYGLVSQMKRSSVSIPSNIAEGKYRGTQKDYRQFLLIAFGSAAELETQLEITRRLSLGDEKIRTLVDGYLLEVLKMLNVLIKRLV